MTKYYVAGPMSNVPQYNAPAFLAAAEDLRNRGLEIELPVDLNDPKHVVKLMASPDGVGQTNKTWGDWLSLDVKVIADKVDGVVVLPGWSHSRGARLETFVCFLCNKPIKQYPSLRSVPKRSLIKAWIGPWKDQVVI